MSRSASLLTSNNRTDDVVSLPAKPITSTQLQLFSTFYGEIGVQDQLSNTIELWDAIPKFAAIDAANAHKKKTGKALAFYKQNFIWYKMPKAHNHPQECQLKLTPAKLETKDGFEEIYPGTTEEMIEEVLRKIFLDQRYGIHDPVDHKTFVKFTPRMIRKRLKDAGRTRSHDQIIQGLLCMNKCNVEVRMVGRRGKALYSAPLLPVLSAVDRVDWLENPDAMWMAQLSPLITEAINQLEYRQYNSETQIEMDSPIARFLHKKLNHEFTNADLSTSYEISYTAIKRDSGHLLNVRTTANLKACVKGIEELMAKGVLCSWDPTEVRDGNKIVDVFYKLIPHYPFTKHMKASNRRHNDNQQRMYAEGHTGPWRDIMAKKQIAANADAGNAHRRQASISKAERGMSQSDELAAAGNIDEPFND